jgi:hypothetical protein
VFGFSLLDGNRSSDLELNLCIMELTRSELSQFGSTAIIYTTKNNNILMRCQWVQGLVIYCGGQFCATMMLQNYELFV